jgi:hypothetical protein
MNSLETKLNVGVAVNPPICFSFLKSVVLHEIMGFINRRIFDKRYKKLIALYNFRERLLIIENMQENAQR